MDASMKNASVPRQTTPAEDAAQRERDTMSGYIAGLRETSAELSQAISFHDEQIQAHNDALSSLAMRSAMINRALSVLEETEAMPAPRAMDQTQARHSF